MVLLYNRAKKSVEKVNEAEVSAKVGSGEYAFRTGIDIPVISPDGTQGTIKTDEAEEAFKNGYSYLTKEQEAGRVKQATEQIKQEEFGENEGSAFVGGALRGATFGLSDVALNAAGVGEAAQEVRERNAISSGVGEVVGGVALGAGTSLGRGLSNAAMGIGAKALPGLATTGVQGIVKKAAQYGLGSAIEGTAYGIGTGITESALGEPDRVVENLFMGGAFGGLFGGIVGGAVGTAAGLAPMAKEYAAAGFSKLTAGLQKGAQNAVSEGVAPLVNQFGAGADAAKAVKEFAADPKLRKELFDPATSEAIQGFRTEAKIGDKAYTREVKDLPKALKRELEDVVAATSGDVQKASVEIKSQIKAIQDTQDAALATQTGPSNKVLFDKLLPEFETSLNKLGEDDPLRKAYKQELLDIQQTYLGKNSAVKTEGEEAAMLLQLRRDLDGKIPYNNLDKAPVEHRAGIKEFQRLRASVDAQLKGHTNPAIAEAINAGDSTYSKFKSLDRVMDRFTRIREPGINGINKFEHRTEKAMRTILDPERGPKLATVLDNMASILPEAKVLSSKVSDAGAMKQAIADINHKLGNSLAEPLTPADILRLKDLMEGLNIGSKTDLAEKAPKLLELQKTFLDNKELSKEDRFMKIYEAMNGQDSKLAEMSRLAELSKKQAVLEGLKPKDDDTLLRIGAGGLVGGPVGTGLAAASAATKNPYLALKTLTMIEKWSNKGNTVAIQAVEGVVNGLTGQGARKVAATTGGMLGGKLSIKNYKEKLAGLAELQEPMKAMEFIEKQAAAIEDAPGVKNALAVHVSRTTSYLYGVAPKDPLADKGMSFLQSNWRPSDIEVSKFMKHVNAADNPTSVLEHFQKGVITPEEVDTVKNLYPRLYEDMQAKVMEAAASAKTLSYQQKIKLGVLFSVPTDYTLTPEFIKATQATFSPVEGEGQSGGGGATRKGELKLSSDMQTDTQRIVNK